MQILHEEKNNKKQSRKAVEKIWFPSPKRDRYRGTCQLPLYCINCAYSCWRKRTYFIIYWWPLVATSNTIQSHTFSLEEVWHRKRKAKKDILSENIYFFCIGKTGKGKFSYKSHFKFQPHYTPLCEPWEVILFVEIHLVQFTIFLDIGAYTGCLTNVFIIEGKMNLSLMELNPTWTAATGLVDSSNKNTEMNAIYSAGIQKKYDPLHQL